MDVHRGQAVEEVEGLEGDDGDEDHAIGEALLDHESEGVEGHRCGLTSRRWQGGPPLKAIVAA